MSMHDQAAERGPGPSAVRFDGGDALVARRSAADRIRRVPLSIWVCFAILAMFLGCATLAPVVAPHDPAAQDLRARLRPPVGFGGTAAYPLGTDALGRDLLSRLLYGARISLAIGVAGVAIGLLLGALTGLAAGMLRGVVDEALMFGVDAFLALPFLVVMLTGVAVFGRSIPVLIVLAGISGWATYTRLARGMALAAREQPYIIAAQALGAGTGRVLLRHILPNAVAPLVVLATFNVTEVILLEASLSFLGVGVKPPTPSWGAMLGEGRTYLNSAWWIALAPGIALMLVTMAISLTGDWLRDVLDPTLRGATAGQRSTNSNR